MIITSRAGLFNQDAPEYVTMRLTISRWHVEWLLKQAPKMFLVAHVERKKWLYAEVSLVGSQWNIGLLPGVFDATGRSYAYTLEY